MSDNGINKNSIKELTELGKNLMTMAGMGNKLTEDDINNKPINDLAITGSMFNDMSSMGNKLQVLSQLSSMLSKLGIDGDMISKGVGLASNLVKIGDKGSKSIENKTDDTLKDIGLNMETFKDMDKLGDKLSQFGDISKMIPGLDSEKGSSLADGLGSILNKMKKK